MHSKSIMFVETYYKNFLHSSDFAKNSSSGGSYENLILNLGELGFGTGGAYTRAFENIGWKSELVVPNSLRLQNAWAEENLNWKPFPWAWDYGLHLSRLPLVRGTLHRFEHMHKVLLEQVKKSKPFALVIQDLNFVPLPLARELKKYCSILIGEIASPPPPKSYFRGYDFIVSALPSILELANMWGIENYYLPLAFDEKWASSSPLNEKSIDAIFIGSFSRHQPNTIELLQAVAASVDNFEIYGPANLREIELAGLSRNYKGEAWGKKMFSLLSQSKVSLNRHGTVAGPYAVNMRMYESTGAGSLLMTEAKENLATLFEPDREVLTYLSPQDAALKINQILKSPEKLAAISAAGQKRTLENHTYKSRAKQLESIILQR